MRIKVTRTVPGMVGYRILARGGYYEVENVTGVSLINDGYAEPAERETPADGRETAVRRPPGRPRRTG